VTTWSAAQSLTASTNLTRLGQALLERAGTSGPLPIAILHDGRVFVQPTAIEIAEALGVNAALRRLAPLTLRSSVRDQRGLQRQCMRRPKASKFSSSRRRQSWPSGNELADPQLPWLPQRAEWGRSRTAGV